MNRKVAIIDPLGSFGSSHHFYLFGQSEGLINSDVEVCLYTNKETDNPNIKGLRFYQFYGFLFSSNKFFSTLKYIKGSALSIFHAKFFGSKFFHFHVFRMRINMLFNLILVKLLFGKVVLTVHDVGAFANNNDASFYAKWIYKLADLVLTHNEFSKEEIIKVTPIPEQKIHIVPHGNYTPFITIQKDKNHSRAKLNLPKDKTILLFFGMIKKVKGLEILLESFKKVIDKNPDTILLIAGKPWENDFSLYQKIIDKNKLSENIILHTKFILHEDVEHYYCASDLVVLPYKKIYQSGVLIMTLSYEKPALVSDLSPLKEIISDNENGFLFQSENAKDLAEKLIKILANKEGLERVRLKGTELINTKYGWDEIGRLTKLAYETL